MLLHNPLRPLRAVVVWGMTLTLLAALMGSEQAAYGQSKKVPKPLAGKSNTKTQVPKKSVDAASAIEAAPQKIDNLYRYLLDATVLIEVEFPEQQAIGNGTGWIVDKERCLVVTNQHVVGSQATAHCLFPKFNGTKLQTNKDGYKESDRIDAVILDSDPNFDLALLKLDSLPKNVRELRLTTRDVSPGEKVHTIAGLPDGTEGMWIYGTGTVRQFSEGRLANGSLTSLMESDIPINQGNSGAAVIDDQGEVVAVAEGYLTQVRGTSLCVGMESIKKYLDIVLKITEPKSAEEWLLVGQRAFEQDRPETALKAFTKGLELDGNLAELHLGRGLVLLDSGDAETAIADFTTALEHDPKNVYGLRGRAMCQEMMGDADAALADLTKAIQKNPEDAAIYNERGCLRTRLEDYEKAEADFNRAIALDDQEPLYLLNRGITRRNLGNTDGSLDDIAAVVDANPEDVEAVNEFGLSFLAKELYQEAGEMFAAAMQFDQTNPDYPQNLGDAYQLQEQHEEALQAYDASLQLESENPQVWYSVGVSQQGLGQLDQAVKSYKQAISQDKEYAEAWYALGLAYKELGNNVQARDAIKKAKQLNPDIESEQ